MEDTYTKLKPGDLKLKALWRGRLISDGDYWLPDSNNPGPARCYPVQVTNIGIIYCRKIDIRDSDPIRANGVNYYSDWEYEEVATEGIVILLPNDKG